MATTVREPVAIHREGSELGAEIRAVIVQSLNRRAIGRSRDGAGVPARPDNIDRGGMT